MRSCCHLILSGILVGFFLIGSTVAFGDFRDDFLSLSRNEPKKVLITDVLRVDMIKIDGGEKIKLIGIRGPAAPKRKKKPERGKYGFIIEEISPIVPVNEQAFNFVRALLKGKIVRLEFDRRKKSDDFQTLAYIFLLEDDTFVNAEILKKGFAFLRIRPPNTKYADLLRKAYREARREKRGLQGE